MALKKLVIYVSMSVVICCTWASADNTAPKLTASEIVEKNVAARGGLQAWRNVKSLSMNGKMDAGGNRRPAIQMPGTNTGTHAQKQQPVEQVQLPFKMILKRPHKQRLEIEFNGKTAVQVYDGANGWKLRPFLNRNDVEPFTAEELKSAASQSELDGLLLDYAAKGTRVELAGIEKMDGRDTYKLQLTLKSGEVRHAWIDAQTFLEAKIEGSPRKLDGQYHPVEIYLKEFRSENGLIIPHVLETKVLGLKGAAERNSSVERILIDNVSVNATAEETLFTKPTSTMQTAAAQHGQLGK
jgi:outer membrane lipoprotein-sorting protein